MCVESISIETAVRLMKLLQLLPIVELAKIIPASPYRCNFLPLVSLVLFFWEGGCVFVFLKIQPIPMASFHWQFPETTVLHEKKQCTERKNQRRL